MGNLKWKNNASFKVFNKHNTRTGKNDSSRL